MDAYTREGDLSPDCLLWPIARLNGRMYRSHFILIKECKFYRNNFKIWNCLGVLTAYGIKR